MIMANNSPSYDWPLDDGNDYEFTLLANDDELEDLQSLFETIGKKSRGDHSENALADPSSNIIPWSEATSHGAFQLSQTPIGSLTTFCSNHGSSVSEMQTFNSGFENLGFYQDVFQGNSLSFGQRVFKETYFERENSNGTFGFTSGINGNPQLKDENGLMEALEVAPNYMEDQFMDLSMYSDILNDHSDKFSMPLFNKKNESEEQVMKKSIHSVMNYETVGSKTCLASGESSLGNSGKESRSGFLRLHRCKMLRKTQGVVKIEKHGNGTHAPTTACKKQSPADGKSLVLRQTSSLSATLKNIRKNAKLKKDDEKSGHQAPLQVIPHRKPEISLQDGGLAVPLLKHRRIALSWMTRKETKSRHCCGGILADDQVYGLGKTISAIALILKERSPPFSTVFATETKEKQTETLNLDEDEDGGFIEQTNPTKNSVAAGTLVVCPTSVLRQWHEELRNRVVNESNLSVLVYYGVNRTKDPIEVAKYDVVLTTYAIVSMEVPKQPLVEEDDDQTQTKLSPNKKRKYPPTSDETSISESIDRPLAKLRWFRVILDEAQSIKNYKTQVARACWGLRAKRRWCLSGTPIQNSIDDLYSYFRFLKYDPFSAFKFFCSQIKSPIQRNPVSGYKRLQLILKTIMLRRTKRTLVKGEPIISLPPKTIKLEKVDFSDEERSFYRRLEDQSRAQFAEYAAAGTVKENYINILLMLLRLRQACDHPLLVKGSSSNCHRRFSIDKAKELPGKKLRRLLNCLEASLAICGICNDPPEDAVVTTCEHVFCNQCILEHLSNDNQCPCSDCKNQLTRSSVFCKSSLKVSIDDHQPSSSGSIQPESSSSIDPAKACDSSKIKAALKVLKGISGNSVVKEKAIVFSQWTRMLDLLEVCLIDSSIGYRRLDGTMSVVARDKAVKDFNTLPEVSVMIMSLKAASLGLNMVAACHVILLDLWWNPTTEDQAIDRAHRIGQTRPVTVLRFTIKDTVEDRILALQQKKREMVESAFGDDDNGGSQTRLTVEDMRYLFQA